MATPVALTRITYSDETSRIVFVEVGQKLPTALSAAQVERLVRIGAAGNAGATPETSDGDERPLDQLTVKELRAHAAQRGIKLPPKARKAAIVRALA